MKPLTAEWVAKAEGDFSTLEREARVTESPNFEGVCFHAHGGLGDGPGGHGGHEERF